MDDKKDYLGDAIKILERGMGTVGDVLAHKEARMAAAIDPEFASFGNREGFKPRSLSVIAAEVRQDWKKVNYAAKPYLDAMGSLDKISDNFYADSGASVVAYFLANASTWRGETARRVKAELKKMYDEFTKQR